MERFHITFNSMSPTLKHGDRVLALTRGSKVLKRGDIVFCRVQADNQPAIERVKRIVGLPGERLEIAKGILLIDNRPLKGLLNLISGLPASFGPVDIPKDHYFLMSDDMNYGRDSRDYGPVHGSNIPYIALLTYRPLNRFQILVSGIMSMRQK